MLLRAPRVLARLQEVRRDTAEIQGRCREGCREDAGEVQGRCRGDIGEMQGRCTGDAGAARLDVPLLRHRLLDDLAILPGLRALGLGLGFRVRVKHRRRQIRRGTQIWRQIWRREIGRQIWRRGTPRHLKALRH